MRTSILIALGENEPRLEAFLKSLKGLKAEILFVANGSAPLLTAFAAHRDQVKLLEGGRNTAENLNQAVGEASGENVLFLDPSSLPQAGWLAAMENALEQNEIAVGESVSALAGKPTPHGRLALKLFKGHSRRTASAKGHSLPWGPACNLGVRRVLFERVGPFAPESGGAFDIDWCWRAVLSGASLAYAPKAKVKRFRANDRESLVREFDRYGLGEAWLHRSFSFLEEGEQDPLLAGLNAFRRLLFHSEGTKAKALQEPLAEVAAAFGSGLRSGLERPHRPSALEREAPKRPIAWWSGKGEKTIYVPGKGLTTLKGKPLALYEAWSTGMDWSPLVQLFRKLFRASDQEANQALHDFISAFSGSSEHEGHHHH